VVQAIVALLVEISDADTELITGGVVSEIVSVVKLKSLEMPRFEPHLSTSLDNGRKHRG
jgi:hypothetical protein